MLGAGGIHNHMVLDEYRWLLACCSGRGTGTGRDAWTMGMEWTMERYTETGMRMRRRRGSSEERTNNTKQQKAEGRVLEGGLTSKTAVVMQQGNVCICAATKSGCKGKDPAAR